MNDNQNDKPNRVFPIGDYHLLSPWFNIIRAIRSVGKSAGMTVVTVKVLLDEKSNPIAWGEIKANRIHPRASKNFIRELYVS